MSQNVSHKDAAEALDSLDDYARMTLGIDAFGPRGMLERYIAQQAATLRQQAARVDEGYAQDLRHLIYLDTQFGWRGETDLKLPEMQALEARGWITEGGDNGEYLVTEEGERALNAVLSAPPLMFADNGADIERRMACDSANACPHCGGSGHKGDAAHALEAALSAQPATVFDARKYFRQLAELLEAGAGLWKVDADLTRLGDAIHAAQSATHPAAPVGVPNAVKLALREARKVAHLYHSGDGMLWYVEQELEKAFAAPSAPQGTQQGEG